MASAATHVLVCVIRLSHGGGRERARRESELRIVVSWAPVCFSNVKIKIPSGVEKVTLFPREREA